MAPNRFPSDREEKKWRPSLCRELFHNSDRLAECYTFLILWEIFHVYPTWCILNLILFWNVHTVSYKKRLWMFNSSISNTHFIADPVLGLFLYTLIKSNCSPVTHPLNLKVLWPFPKPLLFKNIVKLLAELRVIQRLSSLYEHVWETHEKLNKHPCQSHRTCVSPSSGRNQALDRVEVHTHCSGTAPPNWPASLCAFRMSGGLLRSAMDHSVPEVWGCLLDHCPALPCPALYPDAYNLQRLPAGQPPGAATGTHSIAELKTTSTHIPSISICIHTYIQYTYICIPDAFFLLYHS